MGLLSRALKAQEIPEQPETAASGDICAAQTPAGQTGERQGLLRRAAAFAREAHRTPHAGDAERQGLRRKAAALLALASPGAHDTAAAEKPGLARRARMYLEQAGGREK